MISRTQLIATGLIIIIVAVVAYLGISGILIHEGTTAEIKPVTTVPDVTTKQNSHQKNGCRLTN